MVLLKDHNYWVYMMSSRTRVLYCGVTNSVQRRVLEHKTGRVKGFTSKYRCDRLVWMEEYGWVRNAIAREKEVKQMRRELKEALINEQNPAWADLSENCYTPDELARAGKATADSSGRRGDLRNDNELEFALEKAITHR